MYFYCSDFRRKWTIYMPGVFWNSDQIPKSWHRTGIDSENFELPTKCAGTRLKYGWHSCPNNTFIVSLSKSFIRAKISSPIIASNWTEANFIWSYFFFSKFSNSNWIWQYKMLNLSKNHLIKTIWDQLRDSRSTQCIALTYEHSCLLYVECWIKLFEQN